jgi:hypothetical protein
MNGMQARSARRRRVLRRAFLVLGYIALVLQAWNLYLFIGLIFR